MRSKSLILTLFLALATAAGAFGQNRTITGTIRDANQEPVVGAGVLLKTIFQMKKTTNFLFRLLVTV